MEIIKFVCNELGVDVGDLLSVKITEDVCKCRYICYMVLWESAYNNKEIAKWLNVCVRAVSSYKERHDNWHRTSRKYREDYKSILAKSQELFLE